jgi:predicted GIY-YIG superfamily endonuclease
MEQIKVVYTEQVASKREALKREHYLKTSAGRRYLKKICVIANEHEFSAHPVCLLI